MMNKFALIACGTVLASLIGCAADVATEDAEPAQLQQALLSDRIVIATNLATSFCLDSNASGQGYTHGCNDGSYQKWTVVEGGPLRTVRLVNLATGFCLDSNAERKVYTMPCNGGNYQQWRRQDNGDGTVTFINLATSFCLDSDAAQSLYTHSCNGGSYQKWFETEVH